MLFLFSKRSLKSTLRRTTDIFTMTSSFEDILALSNEKTIQQQNLESLLKTYMFVNRLSPPIKNDVFVMLCTIWYHLHNSKNVKKNPWTSVTFSKVTGFSLQLY